MQYPEPWVSALLIASFWKTEVLQSRAGILEYSTTKCWTSTKEDQLPATHRLSF